MFSNVIILDKLSDFHNYNNEFCQAQTEPEIVSMAETRSKQEQGLSSLFIKQACTVYRCNAAYFCSGNWPQLP